MVIAMKNCEEKVAGNRSSTNFSTANNKIRIAVYGQHGVGKSALTVRYLTRKYIGEYNSNSDLLYHQTLSVNKGTTLDIEILDISTVEGLTDRKTFPLEEIPRTDAFVIVYSITDKSSFTFALEALSDISKCYNNSNDSSNSSESPKPSFPVALIGNKSDLEHLRSVDKSEGLSASIQFGAAFYELSVAENSPEVYQSFNTIITNLMGTNHQNKRKFSVSKMFENFRLGRTSSSNRLTPKGPASIVEKNLVKIDTDTVSATNSPVRVKFTESIVAGFSFRRKDQRSRSLSSEPSNTNGFKDSICNIKSKIIELHSFKKRQNSPPICSF